MPFDDAKYDGPAIRGDLGGVALAVSIALDSIRDALKGLKEGKDIAEHIKTIDAQSKKLDGMFDELTGYTDDC